MGECDADGKEGNEGGGVGVSGAPSELMIAEVANSRGRGSDCNRVDRGVMPMIAADPPVVEAPARLLPTEAPNWLRKPTAEQIVQYYPTAAMSAETAGATTTSCTVAASGRLQDCRLESETPEGFGFGDASMKIMRIFQLTPTTKSGEATAGGTVKIPLVFRPRPSGTVGPLRLQNPARKGMSVTIDCRVRASRLENCIPVRTSGGPVEVAKEVIQEVSNQPTTLKVRSGSRLEITFAFD